MKKVFFIKDSTENTISYFHILFFLVSLPFDRLYSELILISLLLHTLIFFSKAQLRLLNLDTLLLSSAFIVTLLSLPYAIYFNRGLDVAGKQLAILLFPVVLTLTRLHLAAYRNRLLLGFTIGCTLTVLYLYADAFHIILFNHLPVKKLFSAAFVNHNFSLPIAMHATYLSMLLAMAIVWMLLQLLTGTQNKNPGWLLCCLLICFAGVIQLGSKAVLLALIIIICAGFPLWVVQKEKRKNFLLVVLPAIAMLMIMLLYVDAFRNRYLQTLERDLQTRQQFEMQNGRLERWKAAAELVKKTPLLGTGSGSEIPLLRNLYYEKKMYAAYLNSLNAHNQFLSFLINNGIAGLAIYLAALFWGCKSALREKDNLLLSFLILILSVSFAEDLLDVNKGIFFYSFFFSFLLLSQKRNNRKFNSYERQPTTRNDEL